MHQSSFNFKKFLIFIFNRIFVLLIRKLERKHMKKFVVVFAAALLFGCSEPKVDADKMNHANEQVNRGEYEEGIKTLDELGKKSPSDPALKQSRVQAHMKYATFFMYNDSIAPKVKYPTALKHYREALKLDPSNADAKEQAQMIVDIYKSMGREVPAEN